jgi:glycosyltransferase involved in cell wall biosynthesis
VATRGPNGAGQPLPRVAFVVETHLGHHTHAMNLRASVESRTDIASRWVFVEYAPKSAWWERIPSLPVRTTLRGRRDVAEGLPLSPRDVTVFNTQVPAAIGPRSARTPPFVLCSDVTPLQLDAMAREYQHRLDRTALVRWAKFRWNRRVLRRASAHAPWSQWVADSLVGDYGVDPDRIEVIPPGVDTTLWTPAGHHGVGPVKVLFVGGDFTRKGGDVLLDAFAALAPGSAELRIVTRSRLESAPGVTVFSDLTPNGSELRALFRTSDVFVLPSRSETFGIAAIEAGASGLPVVVSEVGGLGELVLDSVTGFLVRPGDREDLIQALRRLVSDVDLRRRLGSAARRRVERHFDARRNADRLVDLALRCIGSLGAAGQDGVA